MTDATFKKLQQMVKSPKRAKTVTDTPTQWPNATGVIPKAPWPAPVGRNSNKGPAKPLRPEEKAAQLVEQAKWRTLTAEELALVATYPNTALDYALFLQEPFPLGEKHFICDEALAYEYAVRVLKGAFPAGEKAIARNPQQAFWYARLILRAPFPQGEKAIATEPELAYEYAHVVLKSRFLAGEKTIARDAVQALHYARKVLKAPFPAAEKAIARDPEVSLLYARDVLKGQFKAGEPAMIRNFDIAMEYARKMLKGRFPALEKQLLRWESPNMTAKYLRLIKRLEKTPKQEG